MVVGRIVPENDTDCILDEFSEASVSRPHMVVGGANYQSTVHRRLAPLASNRVRFLSHVDDMNLLWDLHGLSYTCVHGHSVGGTNPELLQAVASKTCAIVFDYDTVLAGLPF